MGYYLMALRNPLHRIQSWFTYERPVKQAGAFYNLKKPLFVDCPFSTINDLAEQGLRADGNATAECHDRAWAAISGTEMHMRHNYYNFGYYLGQTPPNATLLAIRSEHLTEDWRSIERLIDGDEKSVDDEMFKHRNPSHKNEEDKYLSDESKLLLCQALCQEIQTYKEILNRSINLSEEQVQESLTELAEECPTEVRQSTCSSLVSHEATS